MVLKFYKSTISSKVIVYTFHKMMCFKNWILLLDVFVC